MSHAPDPPLTLAEHLTSEFYAWELRGRGWILSEHPVVLEPPFRPFFRTVPAPAVHDDARTPGIFERLAGLLRKRTPQRSQEIEEDSLFDDRDADTPSEDGEYRDLVELQVRLPPELDMSRERAERMFLTIAGAAEPVAFELIGIPGRIILQFACSADDVQTIRHALDSFVPEATVEEQSEFLAEAWSRVEGRSVIVDFGLLREFMLPLGVPSSFAVDPLLAFTSALEAVREGEILVFQLLFVRTAYPWADSIERAISDGEGGSFFEDAPGMLALAREKTSHPLFACVIRAGAHAQSEDRVLQLATGLGTALTQFTKPHSNELVPLESEGYEEGDQADDLIDRRTRRTGMLLGLQELVSIAHLPSSSVRSPALRAPARKTKAAPAQLLAGDVVLGENRDRGKTNVVRLSSSIRLRHIHVIGATGSGKSTLLKNLLREDIAAGRGFGLLDPHGDLADEVIAQIPDSRRDDVVLFDPADEEAPVGFNVFSAKTEREKELLASDLVAVFRRFSTSWGDQMTAVLGNAVLALLEHPEGGTLFDLRRFLVERTFRGRFLAAVGDPAVRSFWSREFPLLKGLPQASILTRLDQFLRPRAVRRVVVQRESKLDLASLIERGGIFIGRLSQGAIGEENAHLLGSLLVAKFQQVALARDRMSERERRDFFLYLDEFHHFVTPSLASLLAGARKYHVGLVLAHQELRQLRDRELESALLTNAATRVCFRLGDDDARKLADGFASFDARDLQSLATFEAICRIERADQDFTIRVLPSSVQPAAESASRISSIRERSRSRWGTPREGIDRALAEAYAEPIPVAPAETAPPKVQEVQRNGHDQWAIPDAPVHTEVSVPKEPVRVVRRTTRTVRVEPGRGGDHHKYLQSFFKHLAEERGFRATIEAPVQGGGHVDLLLERNGDKIACEISVTSTAVQELGNIAKCTRGGFGRVVVLSDDRKVLRKLSAAIKAEIAESDRACISLLTPDEFVQFLDEELRRAPSEREGKVLGYRVKTTVRRIAREDRDAKHASLAQTIVRRLKTMKDKP